jgi:hypothetical protein
MSVGSKIVEDGRFVGYFFKLMAYEDKQGINRASPVFIGRFVWERPILQKSDPMAQEREFLWTMYVAAAIGLVLLVRWGMRQMKPATASAATDLSLRDMRRRWSMERETGEENIDIETWLNQGESEITDSTSNSPEEDDFERGEQKG